MVPERFRASCQFCKRELDTRETGVHQYVKGWVKNRQGGGGHGISLPERENRFAHGHCVERLTEGTFGQAALFEAPAPEPESREPSEPQPTNASVDATGRLIHVCNVCGADAPFGVGVALRRGDLGLWYCGAHLPKADVA